MALQPISAVLFSPKEPSKALLAVLMSFHKNQLDPVSLNGVELVMIVDTHNDLFGISRFYHDFNQLVHLKILLKN